MAVQKLDKSEWGAFFNRVAKGLVGKRAEIEIASLALGDQIEAEWLPILGIVYDPKTDIVEVALEGLDHMIHHPAEIYVDIGGGELANVEVIDDAGVGHIIKLRDPLMLPSPSVAG